MSLPEIAAQMRRYSLALADMKRQVPEQVIAACCETMDICPAQMTRALTAYQVDCKCIIAHELRQCGFTLVEIGAALDKHHATVKYYLKRYQDFRQTDPAFRVKADACAAAVAVVHEPEIILTY